jgi:hypothetical protein
MEEYLATRVSAPDEAFLELQEICPFKAAEKSDLVSQT